MARSATAAVAEFETRPQWPIRSSDANAGTTRVTAPPMVEKDRACTMVKLWLSRGIDVNLAVLLQADVVEKLDLQTWGSNIDEFRFKASLTFELPENSGVLLLSPAATPGSVAVLGRDEVVDSPVGA